MLNAQSRVTFVSNLIGNAKVIRLIFGQLRMEEIFAAEFENELLKDENAILMDVRTAEEYAEGHLENAELNDVMDPEFSTRLDQLDKNKNYYVYCRSGQRSAAACHAMKQLGFKGRLINLAGGILAWKGPIIK